MTTEPLLATHEFLGEWWLDRHEDQKLSGTLTIESGSAELTLIGAFDNQPRDRRTLYNVLGLTTGGHGFTLVDCRAPAMTRSSPGLATTTHRPRYALRGRAWFTEGEEITFDEISFRTSDLEAWAEVRSLAFELKPEPIPGTGLVKSGGIDVSYTTPVLMVRSHLTGDIDRMHTSIGRSRTLSKSDAHGAADADSTCSTELPRGRGIAVTREVPDLVEDVP